MSERILSGNSKRAPFQDPMQRPQPKSVASMQEEAYVSASAIERALWLCTAEICARLDRLDRRSNGPEKVL